MADEREERRKAKREELKSIVAEAIQPLVWSVACIEARQANGLVTDPRERLAMPPRSRDGKTPADVQLAFPATLEQLLVSGSELLPLSRTRQRNPWNKKKSHEFLDFYGIPDDPVSEGEDESTPRARDRRAKIARFLGISASQANSALIQMGPWGSLPAAGMTATAMDETEEEDFP